MSKIRLNHYGKVSKSYPNSYGKVSFKKNFYTYSSVSIEPADVDLA